jgi:predicted nucleic acid-binding protein
MLSKCAGRLRIVLLSASWEPQDYRFILADQGRAKNMDGTTSVSGLYGGFDAYRTPTDADYRDLLTKGLVVLDTNVFLDLYRYSERTRHDLFGVLRSLSDRLWVPRQVMVEFWRNRESRLQDPRDTAKTASELAAGREQMMGIFRAWSNRVGLEARHRDPLADALTEAFDRVIAGVNELADDDASHFARDTNSDPILADLEPILQGRVGPALDKTEYNKALEEAKRRIQAKEPPGYKDAGKAGVFPAGDYLVWLQTLREAKRRQQDVLVVTGDVKEDWWRREFGELRGPRPELAEEMRAEAGSRLYLLRPESLLVHARRVLQVEVHDESVKDVERVTEAENGGWTFDTIGQFLSKLAHEGRREQEQAIRLAAVRGGFIEREIVATLGGYGEGQSLRGFSRPINRIAQEFRDQGIVPPAAVDVLQTEYDPNSGLSAGWATGFRIPDPLVPLIREWQRLRHSEALREPDPELTEAALEEFRTLGHVVDAAYRHNDAYGLPEWTCQQCGSAISLVDAGAKWISPSGRSPCPR